jgi:osmotically-inducible protein OsmY
MNETEERIKKEIGNNLTPKSPNDLRPTDQELQVTIKDALLWDSDVDPSDITLTVVSGLVTLDGSVGSYGKKVKAGELAAGIKGVVQVINNLVVVPENGLVDRAVAKDISRALEGNPAVNPDTIDVGIQDGKVRLSGTVPGRRAYQAVEAIFRNIPGVVNIENDLIIAQV